LRISSAPIRNGVDGSPRGAGARGRRQASRPKLAVQNLRRATGEEFVQNDDGAENPGRNPQISLVILILRERSICARNVLSPGTVSSGDRVSTPRRRRSDPRRGNRGPVEVEVCQRSWAKQRTCAEQFEDAQRTLRRWAAASTSISMARTGCPRRVCGAFDFRGFAIGLFFQNLLTGAWGSGAK